MIATGFAASRIPMCYSLFFEPVSLISDPHFGVAIPETFVRKKTAAASQMLKHNVAHRSWPFLGRARQYNASPKIRNVGLCDRVKKAKEKKTWKSWPEWIWAEPRLITRWWIAKKSF